LESEDFINILERKEITEKLKKFISPIVKKLIADKLKDIFDEILELDKNFELDPEGRKIKVSSLLEQNG